MSTAAAAYHSVRPLKWTGVAREFERDIPAEAAVAIVYNGTAHAVMMATPADLEDFAVGFALTEELVENAAQIKRIEVLDHPNGIEARLWLDERRARALLTRRRHMAGPSGCGLCGIESLDQVVRSLTPVTGDFAMSGRQVVQAMIDLRERQTLNGLTRAVHGAAFWTENAVAAVREDVGRHNALDKLIGALAREDRDMRSGAVLLTSRLSLELVQKSAKAGCPVLIAVSAPTDAAINLAAELGMTVVGITRDDGFEVFCNPRRIRL